MSWFSRVRAPKPATEEADRLQLPGGLWTKCPKCSEIVYSKELERGSMVCPKCDYHFRLGSQERIDLLCDRNSFEELHSNIRTNDPLNFRDQQKYRERLRKAEKANSTTDAIRVGRARIDGLSVMLGVFEYRFMGGSMGLVVGEKLARMIENATANRLPVIIVSASGGARMQEGIFSLMQMARVTQALMRHGRECLPYISVLTDPTMGGVAASFAMQGDIHIAEPGALIGFAGPRLIEQIIKKKLPEGFQRSEFLVEHGMVDFISHRSELKANLSRVLRLLTGA